MIIHAVPTSQADRWTNGRATYYSIVALAEHRVVKNKKPSYR